MSVGWYLTKKMPIAGLDLEYVWSDRDCRMNRSALRGIDPTHITTRSRDVSQVDMVEAEQDSDDHALR